MAGLGCGSDRDVEPRDPQKMDLEDVFMIYIYIYNYHGYDYDICYCYCDTIIMLYYDYCSRCYIISILTTNLVFT